MADPFAIIQSGMLDIGKINSDYNLNRYRGLEAKVYAHKAAQEDATAAREAAARAAIGRGAKPDEVMAQDLDMGAKYADYVAKNGDQAHETAQRQAGAIVQIGTALKSVPRGPQRQGIWARALPVLKSVGVTDADLANFDPNDDNAIDAQVISHKALLKAGEDYTLGRTRFSGATNAPLASVPEDDKWVPVPAGGFLQRIPGSGSQPMDEQPYHSPLDAPGETLKGAGGDFHSIVAAEGGTNPDGSFRTSPKGAIGPAQLMPGTIPEAAQLAGVDPKLVYTDPAANLAAGKAYHDKQLRDFGDPALAAAAYNAGPGRVREALAQGGPQGWMQHVPAETQAYVPKVMGGRQGAAAPANTPDRIYGGPPAAPSGYRYKSDGSALEPIPGGPADPGGADGSAISNIRQGDIKSVPHDAQGIVQSIIDGRFPITSRMTSPKVIQYFQMANAVDPSVDAATYVRRAQTARAFAPNGKQGTQLISGKTLIDHLYDLAQLSDKLGGSSLTPLNSLHNWYLEKTSDPALSAYESSLSNVADEQPKFLAGTATIPGIAQVRKDYDPTKGPESRKAAITATLNQMDGRFQQLLDSYSTGMNKQADIHELLGRQSAKLDALRQWASAPGAALPQIGTSPVGSPLGTSGEKGGAKIPPGAVYVGTSQGRPVYKVNGRNWTP